MTSPAAAAANVPVGYQSTLQQTQSQLVAQSDATIVPKLVGAIGPQSTASQDVQELLGHGIGGFANYKS